MTSKALTQLGKAGPAVAKQLPKLWPLLLESRNREKLIELAQGLADQSPKRRLATKSQLTAAVADHLAVKASSPQEQLLAEEWARRARNLALRVEMPVVGRQARRAHRQSVRAQLSELQAEMNAHLGQ